MPNQRKTGLARVGFWIVEKDKKRLQREAKKENMNLCEYIRYKLGVDK